MWTAPDSPVGRDCVARAPCGSRKSRAYGLVFILSGWQEGSDSWDSLRREPERLDYHAPGQDTTSVFLARITLPLETSAPPVRMAGAAAIDNDSRPFVYSTGALLQWLSAA